MLRTSLHKNNSIRLRKDNFFKTMDDIALSLTYGDVRLKTGYSEVLPHQTNLKTYFSRNVPLNIPIVSAAMDTVTEYDMAIAMAMMGGIGVIHKNLSPEEQAKQIDRVKLHLNAKTGLLEKPIYVHSHQTIQEVLDYKKTKGFEFNSFPVIEEDGKLVGMLTGNDFLFCVDKSKTVMEIMNRDVVTVDANQSYQEIYDLFIKEKKKVFPAVNSDGKIIGLYTFKDISNMHTGVSSLYNIDSKGRLRVAAAIGVKEKDISRLEMLLEKEVDVIVLDTAHADTKDAINMLNRIKRDYNIDVIAGNISEPESARRLAFAGADGIKVGQGPGSICTTRIVAGIGCPQVTAIYNCSKVADKFGIPVIADGGLQYSGDITVAIGAGASSVMMGSMLSGTIESPGSIIFKDGRQWKEYRGMGSLGAMESGEGSRDRYSQNNEQKLVPEGVEGLTPFKGPVQNVVFVNIGGFQSGMGYVGARTIEELRKKADFRRITDAGQKESHPHDIFITREAPNYHR